MQRQVCAPVTPAKAGVQGGAYGCVVPYFFACRTLSHEEIAVWL